MKTLPAPTEELFSVEHKESINNATQTKLIIPFHRTTVGLSLISYQAPLPIKKTNSLKRFCKDL